MRGQWDTISCYESHDTLYDDYLTYRLRDAQVDEKLKITANGVGQYKIILLEHTCIRFFVVWSLYKNMDQKWRLI